MKHRRRRHCDERTIQAPQQASSDFEGSPPLRTGPRKDRAIGVSGLDQGHILRARTALDLVLAGDGFVLAVAEFLEDQPVAKVAAGETLHETVAPFAGACARLDVTPA